MAVSILKDARKTAVFSAPGLETLVAVRLQVLPEVLDEYLSYHHAVTTIIRGLIVTNPEIIGCPGLRDNELCIIISEQTWKKRVWRTAVDRLHLKITDDRKNVPMDTLNYCIWYTITSRLSPEWNRVGTFLIQGSDFLADASYRTYRALTLEAVCSPPGRLQLKLSAYTLSMAQMKLKEIGERLAGIGNQPDTGANDSNSFQQCVVLPKQSISDIVSVSKTIPTGSIFGSYTMIRDYWESMYGYRLPEEKPEFYCEVKFHGMNGPLFTYPNYCLLSKKIEAVPASNAESTGCVEDFLRDLSVQVPTLCGQDLKPIRDSPAVRRGRLTLPIPRVHFALDQ